MQEQTFLSEAEKVLSKAWGDDLRLTILDQQAEHEHVLRLAVEGAALDRPQTVILKRWRIPGEERFSAEFSASHFFNDWAGLEFLSTVLGDETLTPKIYAGNQTHGFFLMEDLAGTEPLSDTLWNQNRAQATAVLIRYGEFLGRLHGKTWEHLDTYTNIRQGLGREYPLPQPDYLLSLQEAVNTMEKLNFKIPSSARDDLSETANFLSQPENLLTFTHGDPVLSNIIAQPGSWRLIDFEAARFRPALLEGSYPRLYFPTSGLKNVFRIPEALWRQAETAYRNVFSHYHPAAKNDAVYGTGMMAACVFWVLDFCHGWLERALVGSGPPVMIKRIRQCMIARSETLIKTSLEFQGSVNIRNMVEKAVQKWRASWPAEDCDLPVYPAFR